MIRLEPINKHNFRRIVDMKLSEEQNRFVAPNVVSLAQAWLYYDSARPFAVCNAADVVGFLMLDWDKEERSVGIWRFMIAPEHQRKGYGRAAMEAAIELARSNGEMDFMYLDYVPGNTAARELYYALGFCENGEVEDGEIIMTMPLTDNPKVGMLTADEEDMDDFIELLEKEKQKGKAVPAVFNDVDLLKREIEAGNVKRFTIMGKTIGLATGKELLIAAGSHRYYDEAVSRLRS